jgi:hypothetical protein
LDGLVKEREDRPALRIVSSRQLARKSLLANQ